MLPDGCDKFMRKQFAAFAPGRDDGGAEQCHSRQLQTVAADERNFHAVLSECGQNLGQLMVVSGDCGIRYGAGTQQVFDRGCAGTGEGGGFGNQAGIDRGIMLNGR